MYKRVLFVIALGILLVGMTGIVLGEITMLPSAKNPDVDPQDGNWDDSFNYSVEVIFDEEIDVELWIWDPWFSEWTYQGTAKYSNTTNWERIYWNATKPFSEECVGMVSKFKFKWNETDLKERRYGKLVTLMRPGPRIETALPRVELKNGNVSKGDATYLDELNYSIEVKANKAVDIELRVYDPCLGVWKSMGVLTASAGGEKLSWERERPFFETKCKKGSSKFLFYAYYKGELLNKSETYLGPNLIPLVEFRNPKVEPSDGRYNWIFNYSVEIVNVTEHVTQEEIKLEVLNPHNLNRTTFNQTGKINNTLMWSVKPFIDDPDCRGTAKYYFKYDDDRWPEVPCYGPEITPRPLELKGWVNSTTAERGNMKMEYYVHTGYVTPFDFTASSNRDVDLELLICDPEAGGLKRKGSLQHCKSGGNVTWNYIKPFDSNEEPCGKPQGINSHITNTAAATLWQATGNYQVKENKIKDYLGKRFDFTFMYGGDIYEEDFQGPELVVAFKDPKYPEEVIYGEMFNYSIEVIASETLNVTLQYYNGTEWVSANKTDSVKDYIPNEWETLTWNCTATEQWKDVRFKWWEEGKGTKIAGTASLELSISQISASRRSYSVPVMVKEEK